MSLRRRMLEFPSWVRYRIRSLKAGFNVEDTFSLDVSMAKWITPRLKYFKENLHGYPPDVTPEQWDEILEEMYIGFKVSSRRYEDFPTTAEKAEKIKRALELFHKYYFDLWD